MSIDNLQAGANYQLRLHARAGTNTYASNWFTFQTSEVTKIIVDNSDSAALFSGSWNTTTSSNGWGTSYRWASSVAGNATATAIYRPNLPVAGQYDVALYYYSPPTSTNQAPDVPHLISYQGGSELLLVDQTINNQQWVTISENKPFQAGISGYVSIANDLGYTGKVVLADGMRFTLRDSPPAHTIVYRIEISPDLVAWEATGAWFTEVSVETDPDGRTERVTLEFNASVMDGGRNFVRIGINLL